MANVSFTIKPLTTIEECQACEEAQKKVWGLPERDIVPAHLLITAARNGGLLAGAFDPQGQMIGFVFGLLGCSTAGLSGLKHCSHMLGVLEADRDSGIGYALKLAQREHVLSQGLDLVTWTYDPLEGRNAFFNFAKLGVIGHTYEREVYGAMADAFNVGLPSDRFTVEWWVRGDRVVQRLRGGPPPLHLATLIAEEAAQVLRTEPGANGLLVPLSYDLNLTKPALLVQIPESIQAIKGTDMGLAQEWRMATRAIFESYFARGYTALEFLSERDERGRRNFYLLRKVAG